MRARIPKEAWPLAALASAALLLPGCADAGPMHFGEAVDVERATSLAGLLADGPPPEGTEVVVRGRIGEVCASSGCWFVLQDSSDGRLRELFVDLKAGADFTLSTDVRGREGTVVGTLAGAPPDLQLRARGVTVE